MFKLNIIIKEMDKKQWTSSSIKLTNKMLKDIDLIINDLKNGFKEYSDLKRIYLDAKNIKANLTKLLSDLKKP